MAVGRAPGGDELLFAVTEAVVVPHQRYRIGPDIEVELFMLAPSKSPAEQLPE